MALPLLSSLACSRLRLSGILGVGIPLSSCQDMDGNLAKVVLMGLRFFVAGNTSKSLRGSLCVYKLLRMGDQIRITSMK